ncbi:MAG: hypothetical protein LUE22_00775 [Oscillospiraceae bacterium]|nr:hypothetical protein [Oscillospiraceae bacterium]
MSEQDKYRVSEEEAALLERYEGIAAQRKDPYRYDTFSKESLAMLCRLKDKTSDLFFRRAEAAREVIDIIAAAVGIDPKDTSFWLYAPDYDSPSRIVKIIEDWVSYRGVKAQLKKRVQELERENSLLRSVLQPGNREANHDV